MPVSEQIPSDSVKELKKGLLLFDKIKEFMVDFKEDRENF